MARVRPALSCAFATALLAGSAAARGWVEKTVLSDSVTIDVERDRTAVVAHEILFGIRGGPLPELSFSPVDAESEVLGDSTATLAKSGTAAGFPIPLGGAVDGARLALKVQVGKGLRSGTYLIRFRYKTSFASADRIHPTDSGRLVEWSGPSFADGIDSARVVFRLPRSASAPRAPSSDGSSSSNVAEDPAGVFLTTVRRGTDKDEIELSRPHVAKGEIVTWRALVDPGTFDVVPEPSVKSVESPAEVATPVVAPAAPTTKPSVWIALAAFSLAFGALVAQKASSTKRACESRRAAPRPLVPVPIALRAAIASLALFGAGVSIVETLPPLVALSGLLVALAVATHLPPRLSPPLRGPGDWSKLDPDAGLTEHRLPRPPGRLLDVATPLGFVVFIAVLAAFVAGAFAALHHSPYYGVAVGLCSSILFPLFCTGRPSEIPLPPAVAPIELIEWLLSELGGDPRLELGIIRRVPRGTTDPDELRLMVLPRKSVFGLRAIEVGVDVHEGPLGAFTLPFVIVRTLDGSPAADALPKGLYVTRGRGLDERVAVLRPKIPTERMVLRLLKDLVRRFSLDAKDAPKGQPDRSASSSAGKGAVAVKPGTASSPAHAT